MKTYTVPGREGKFVSWAAVGQPEIAITRFRRWPPLVEIDEARRWWELVLGLPAHEVHPDIRRDARKHLRSLGRVR